MLLVYNCVQHCAIIQTQSIYSTIPYTLSTTLKQNKTNSASKRISFKTFEDLSSSRTLITSKKNPVFFLFCFLGNRTPYEVDQVHTLLCAAFGKSHCSLSQMWLIIDYNSTMSVPYLCIKLVEYLFIIGIQCSRKYFFFTIYCRAFAMLTAQTLCPAFSTIKTVSFIAVSEVWLPIVSYINLFKGMSWGLLVQRTSALFVAQLWSAECWDD